MNLNSNSYPFKQETKWDRDNKQVPDSKHHKGERFHKRISLYSKKENLIKDLN